MACCVRVWVWVFIGMPVGVCPEFVTNYLIERKQVRIVVGSLPAGASFHPAIPVNAHR